MAEHNTHDVLTVDQRFAIVPEWVIDANISDTAFRLYAVLLRYGQTSGQRMPSRQLLARRLRKSSTDTVDRAMKELVTLGAVQVERRRRGKENLTNRYHLRTVTPARRNADGRIDTGSRKSAATPDNNPSVDAEPDPGRRNAATPGRKSAGRVAANLRPNPEQLTQKDPPPTPPTHQPDGRAPARREEEKATQDTRQALLRECGIDDLDELARNCALLRRQHRRPTGRWRAECLHAALHLAVRNRGWPAEHAVQALLEVAADPATYSPMRVAEAGPWWDTPTRPQADTVDPDELADAEQRLDALDGGRLALQREARRELQAERMPLTRATVTQRACQLLDQGWLNRADAQATAADSS